MKGGMIIKEILACIRGKEAFPREWEAGKRGKRPFRRGFFDTMAAEAVLKIREALPVRLHLILPCKGQSDRWHFAEKRRYREILKQADTAEFLFERYTPDCMLRRDDAMVARSGYCVCYLRDPAAKRGGTAYTVRRAKKEGLEIIHLIPVEVEQLTLL